ncbi:glycosyltransferase family A protein [Vagococcus carniphilus]|uniref:glycosyltransferase family A protein n=1 Tax=Vagococcus carniphilus TaxID=218144 RepID=UPI00288E59A2|nr:glycosyltransferase family A protein [Vagococcus carniphilus]MDT2813652.1 glycosyltransferase family A protein [Vagococcus carniphilus]
MIRMEYLISTMFCNDGLALYKKMNIKSNAIIINQSNLFNYCEYIFNDSNIKVYTFDEKGIGISRNSALMRSSADICIISDDDMVYVDNSSDIIKNAYKKYPDADMIVFNVRVHQNREIRNTVKKNGRVHMLNSLRYGTVTFTFRRDSIINSNIFFSLDFGGGAKYGSGEDSIFIWDVIRSGHRVYSVSDTIADVYNDDSSWFEGYNEKYFYDRGALFKKLSKNFYKILIIQFIIRKKDIVKKSSYSKKDLYKIMSKGASNYGKKKN